jgi:2',3'-cyclic-nucleotide 2'-phosphodiesterase (5'-nucleotidase family)
MKNVSRILVVIMLALSLLKLDYSDLGNWELNKKAYMLLLVSAVYGFMVYLRNRKLQ